MEIPISTLGDQSKNEKFLNSTLKKENDDYWKCMALTTGSRYELFQIKFYVNQIGFFSYILLIEDDAVVIPEFSNLLKSLVRKLDDHEYVDFVKLYHPNYLRKLPSYALVSSSLAGRKHTNIIFSDGCRIHFLILLLLLCNQIILQNIPSSYFRDSLPCCVL